MTIGASFRLVILSINFLCSLQLNSKTQNERGRMNKSPKRIHLLKVTKKVEDSNDLCPSYSKGSSKSFYFAVFAAAGVLLIAAGLAVTSGLAVV